MTTFCHSILVIDNQYILQTIESRGELFNQQLLVVRVRFFLSNEPNNGVFSLQSTLLL